MITALVIVAGSVSNPPQTTEDPAAQSPKAKPSARVVEPSKKKVLRDRIKDQRAKKSE